MRIRKLQKAACSGFTMLELMISLGLFSVVLGLGATIGGSAQDAYTQSSGATQLESKVRTTLDRIVEELEHGALDTMIPTLDVGAADSNLIAIQQVSDIVAGVPVMSNFMVVAFTPETTDPGDGIDNDGDGLIDEGQVVLMRDVGLANATTVTLCKGVARFLEGETAGAGDENGNGATNEAGLLFQRDGDLLTISLTLVGAQEGRGIDTRTSSVSVMLRN
jgi:prepilin-type N-terminal cleavage/methylation domain-containing protein